jgi:hypothetical protein
VAKGFNSEGQATGAGGLSAPFPQQTYPSAGSSTTYPGGLGIDIAFEAGKLPLDVAIFNSARAAGGDEKIRKYLQAVLVVGGTALVPGMAHALESRCVAVSGRYSLFISLECWVLYVLRVPFMDASLVPFYLRIIGPVRALQCFWCIQIMPNR